MISIVAACLLGFAPATPPTSLFIPTTLSPQRVASLVATERKEPTPERISSLLLVGDAGAMITWCLGLSSLRTLGKLEPTLGAAGADLTRFLVESKLDLTVEYIAIESYSAVALTLAWCIGATLGGALSDDWWERAREAEQQPFGVLRTLLKSWAFAIPLAELGKIVAVAAVILPVGGWLAFDPAVAVQDLGGMLLAVALWRTVLLQLF